MKARVIAVGLIEYQNKILIGRKPKDIGPYPNTWHIPGGGANLEKEALKDALKREMLEEAGIEIFSIEPIGFDEDYTRNKHNEIVHYVFLQFRAVSKSDKITPGDDMQHLEWAEKEKLAEFEFNQPTEKLFKKLGLIKK